MPRTLSSGLGKEIIVHLIKKCPEIDLYFLADYDFQDGRHFELLTLGAVILRKRTGFSPAQE
jgi:hypothetical protein